MGMRDVELLSGRCRALELDVRKLNDAVAGLVAERASKKTNIDGSHVLPDNTAINDVVVSPPKKPRKTAGKRKRAVKK